MGTSQNNAHLRNVNFLSENDSFMSILNLYILLDLGKVFNLYRDDLNA